MSKFLGWFAVESHRAYLYRLSVAVGAGLTTAGLTGHSPVMVAVGAVQSILSTSLAAVNTSTKAKP